MFDAGMIWSVSKLISDPTDLRYEYLKIISVFHIEKTLRARNVRVSPLIGMIQILQPLSFRKREMIVRLHDSLESFVICFPASTCIHSKVTLCYMQYEHSQSVPLI